MEAWEPWTIDGVPKESDLVHGEIILMTQGGVGMYDGEMKVPDRAAGTLVITTHRLAYIDEHSPRKCSAFIRLPCIRQSEHYAGFLRSSPKITLVCARQVHVAWTCHVCGTIHNSMTLDGRCQLCGVIAQLSNTLAQRACPTCTYLNDVERRNCDMCGTWLDLPASLMQSICKLSFRQGGDRLVYSILRDTLKEKPWTMVTTRSGTGAGLLGMAEASPNATSGAMPTTAFEDLESLMRQARRMVDFANSLRTELERHERGVSAAATPNGEEQAEEAGTLLQSALVQLGLPNPAVTPDMVKNERAYHRELACELAGVLLGEHGLLGPGRVVRDASAHPDLRQQADIKMVSGPVAGRGLMPLDEVWGLWNRARGVALVSPKLLRSAAVYLPDVTSPCVKLRELRSGVTVLHTPYFDDAAVESRVLAYLDEAAAKQGGGQLLPGLQPGLTTPDVAALEKMPVPLVRQLLEGVEHSSGAIVRDECGTQDTRWFRNCIS